LRKFSLFDKALKVRQARSNGNLTTIGQVAEIVTMVILGKVLISLGWKWTMIVGIAGHAARFAAFSFFGNEDHQWIIIAVQVVLLQAAQRQAISPRSDRCYASLRPRSCFS
jgi:hypothetical protein